jgi:hypothetical protein
MTVALPQDTDVRHGDRRAAAQVGEWFRTWQATGDPAIRERIILAHLGMAERLATRFRHTRDVGHDDLVQAARVGLVAAVDRFEPNRGTPSSVTPWSASPVSCAAACATPAGRSTSREPSRSGRCRWCGHAMR